ncbi:hypothetical protein CRG98_006180 [Punica granatum]|uniref:Uncharacterized protein n=1 Tax=Punica granatum TaxID=22663 RepID=A0A2I0KYK2_PUNGR|nr:hypothetical protein CRG98_006180 [Punica granatum]
MCSEAVKVLSTMSLHDLMTGGVKTESPPIAVFLHFNWSEDSLCTCPESSSGDVIVLQENLPNHAIGDSCLILDCIIFFAVDSDELAFDKEFQFLMQRGRNSACGMNPWPPEQEDESIGYFKDLVVRTFNRASRCVSKLKSKASSDMWVGDLPICSTTLYLLALITFMKASASCSVTFFVGSGAASGTTKNAAAGAFPLVVGSGP